MKIECFKCKSHDVINVDGIIMCNKCGEILNADSKKDITLKIDKVISRANANNLHTKLNSKDLCKIKINNYENPPLSKKDFYEFIEKYDLDNEDIDIMDNEELWTYIDDVEGLSEDLEYEDYNNQYEEKYPGLLVAKKHK